MSVTRNKTKNSKNNTLAMLAAAPAMLVNPNTPAINAINKNVTVHPNIVGPSRKICAKPRVKLSSP